MKPTYRVKGWEQYFESAESKRIKHARWVLVPNRHDGKSYGRVAAHADNVALFCAWQLIIEVASKMPVRGILADDDGALDADDLAAKTRFPAQIFELAFAVLTEPRIGWLVVEEQDAASLSTASPSTLQDAPSKPQDAASDFLHRRERKGTEGNGTVGRSPALAGARACDEVGRLPELEDARRYVHYCVQRGQRIPFPDKLVSAIMSTPAYQRDFWSWYDVQPNKNAADVFDPREWEHVECDKCFDVGVIPNEEGVTTELQVCDCAAGVAHQQILNSLRGTHV